MEQLRRDTVTFRRAYATDCWTLPTHVSMFTGLLPSEHGAHFQSMALRHSLPTVAELLTANGYHTELVTRNFVFDGTIPGAVRGFQHRSRPLAPASRLHPVAAFLALAKPRVRRHIQRTGFFHPLHPDQRGFVRTFARSLMPADGLALTRVLQVMAEQRRARRPYFIFCNLYDVHAPYAPAPDSLFQPWDSLRHAIDNIAFPAHLAKLGQHAYLREGFRLPPWAQRALRDRYHRAIESIDAQLATFYDAARASGGLDDTLLIVTSDHGEAFGEHGLYLHDASVYDTHLHVPLSIRRPERPAAMVDDPVSTRDLFGVMLAAARLRPWHETILDSAYRSRRPLILAEHFYYPHCDDMAGRFRRNLLAMMIGDDKFVIHKDGAVRYDRRLDPDESLPTPTDYDGVGSALRRGGVDRPAADSALERIRRWQSDATTH